MKKINIAKHRQYSFNFFLFLKFKTKQQIENRTNKLFVVKPVKNPFIK